MSVSNDYGHDIKLLKVTYFNTKEERTTSKGGRCKYCEVSYGSFI